MEQVESGGASLGPYLRSMREAKGGSLEDMARSTRVGIRHLEALEDERLIDLPSPVFVRGFIRAYCGFLRESPDPALARYERLAGARAAAHAASAPPRGGTNWAMSSLVVGLVLLLILGGALILVNLSMRRSAITEPAMARTQPTTAAPAAPPSATPVAPAARSATPDMSAPVAPPPAAIAPSAAGAPAATPPAASTVPAASASPAPAATPPPAAPSATPPRAATPAPPAGGQRLVVRAIEPTWIRVQTDSGRVAEELLPAGASREWAAERRFLVTIGNAGGVELTLNGKALPSLGPKGTVIQRLELPAPDANPS